MKRTIQLKNKEDFLQFSLIKNIVTDSTTITNNSCSYNNNYDAFRINDSSGTTKGAIEIPLGILYVGDIVTVTAEVMNVSGVKSKVALDVITPSVTNIGMLQSEKSGYFETISCSFMCTKNNQEYKVVLGTFLTDIGDYYVRNVSIEIETTGSNIIKPVKEAKRVYNISPNGTNFELKTAFSPDICTIEATTFNSALKCLKITHAVPFTSTYRGISAVNISSASPLKYDVRSQSEQPNLLYVVIYDKTTNTVVDPATVVSDTTIWISVVHYGYDI